MSVWKSGEKLLNFVSLFSPSKIILFEKQYQAFDTMFHHQMKHLEVVKNTPLCVVFSTLFLVFHQLMKHCILYAWYNYYFKNYMIHFILFQFTIILGNKKLFQVCFIGYISSQMVCGIPVCHVLQVQPLLCEFPLWMCQFIKWHWNWG